MKLLIKAIDWSVSAS